MLKNLALGCVVLCSIGTALCVDAGDTGRQPFKPMHAQNPSSLYVSGERVDMGDGSFLYAGGERTIRFWPRDGRIDEQPISEYISAASIQKLATGILFVGGDRSGVQGLIGDDRVRLLRPDGSMIQAKLQVPRFNAQSTVLGSNAVLVVGGTLRYEHNGRSLKEIVRTTAAEVVQYRDGKLEIARVPDLPGSPRHSFRIVTLVDGRAMVMGGSPSSYNACNSCIPDTWLFDPKTRQWQAGPPMKAARSNFSATRLTDGRVLVVGGWTLRGSDSDDRVEVFDPRTNRWEDFPSLPSPSCDHKAVWLEGEEGRTLIVGGGTNPQIQALDVNLKRWMTVGEMKRYRIGAELFTYRDKQRHPWVLLSGGVNFPRGQNPSPDYAVERIPLRTVQQTVDQSREYQLQRSDVAVAFRSDGHVLLAGGSVDADPGYVSTASADVLAPRETIPVAIAALSRDKTGAHAFWLPSGGAVVVGGTSRRYNDLKDLKANVMEWFSPQSGRWSDVVDASGQPMSSAPTAAYAQYPDGALLVVSGQMATRLTIKNGQGSYESLPSLQRQRETATAKVLADGQIIAAGGSVQGEFIAVVDEASDGEEANASSEQKDVYESFGPMLPSRRYEIFDPRTQSWKSSAPSRAAGGRVAILDNGSVIKVGQLAPGEYRNDLWIAPMTLMEMSTPDGSRWDVVPLPMDMYTDATETRPFVQDRELFLEGTTSARDRIGLWWFSAKDLSWTRLTDWVSNSAYSGKLVVEKTPNEKRVVRIWPQAEE